MEDSPDGLFPLCLPDLWLLVPLSHDVIEGGAGDGPLELCGAACALLSDLLLLALLVLAAVQYRPVDLARIALHRKGLFTVPIQELEPLW